MKLVFAALTAVYPLALWLAADRVEPRWLATGLLLLVGVRVLAGGGRGGAGLAAAALGLAVLTVVLDVPWPLKLYPVAVNAALLVTFAVTLVRGPSMAERLARLREPHLPPHAVAYTRRVTQVWCGFFVVNGAVAAATAAWASDRVWAMYNGGVAYGLMAALAAGELLVRTVVKRRHALATASAPGPGR